MNMNMNIRVKSSIAIILILSLFTSACGSNQILTSLELVVSAAEVALPIISSQVGLSPATLAKILGYLKQVNVAIVQASIILSSTTLTPLEKSEQVILLFTGLAKGCNCLPNGTAQVVVEVVDGVVRAIINLLTNFKPPPTTMRSNSKVFVVPANIKVTRDIKKRLDSIKGRAEIQLGKLK